MKILNMYLIESFLCIFILTNSLNSNEFNLSECNNSVICKVSNYTSLLFENGVVFNPESEQNIRKLHVTLNRVLYRYFNYTILQLFKYSNIKVIETGSYIAIKNCHKIEVYNQFYTPIDKYENIDIITPKLFDFVKNFDPKLMRCLQYNQNLTQVRCESKNITLLNIRVINLDRIRSLFLKNNNIRVLKYNNANLFRYARNLVYLNLKNNPIKQIECDTFISALNLRFIVISENFTDNEQIACILQFNQNIQEIQYSIDQFEWNHCSLIEQCNRTTILKEYIFFDLYHLFLQYCTKSVSFFCDINLFGDYKSAFLKVTRNTKLRQINIENVRDDNVLSLYKDNFLNLKYANLIIFYNCDRFEYEIFSSKDYEPYRHELKFDSDILNFSFTNNNIDRNFENCIRLYYLQPIAFCDSKNVREMIVISPRLLINLRSLSLRNNEITYLESSVITPAVKLVFLDLSYNPVLTINPNAFKNFPNLKQIYLFEVLEHVNIAKLIEFNNNIQKIRYGFNGSVFIFNTCDRIETYRIRNNNVTYDFVSKSDEILHDFNPLQVSETINTKYEYSPVTEDVTLVTVTEDLEIENNRFLVSNKQDVVRNDNNFDSDKNFSFHQNITISILCILVIIIFIIMLILC